MRSRRRRTKRIASRTCTSSSSPPSPSPSPSSALSFFSSPLADLKREEKIAFIFFAIPLSMSVFFAFSTSKGVWPSLLTATAAPGMDRRRNRIVSSTVSSSFVMNKFATSVCARLFPTSSVIANASGARDATALMKAPLPPLLPKHWMATCKAVLPWNACNSSSGLME